MSTTTTTSSSSSGNIGGGGQFGDTTYTKVFVGGLAWETQKDTMKKYFEQFGEILEAVVIFDKNTGRSKGYGFVSYFFFNGRVHLNFFLSFYYKINCNRFNLYSMTDYKLAFDRSSTQHQLAT